MLECLADPRDFSETGSLSTWLAETSAGLIAGTHVVTRRLLPCLFGLAYGVVNSSLRAWGERRLGVARWLASQTSRFLYRSGDPETLISTDQASCDFTHIPASARSSSSGRMPDASIAWKPRSATSLQAELEVAYLSLVSSESMACIPHSVDWCLFLLAVLGVCILAEHNVAIMESLQDCIDEGRDQRANERTDPVDPICRTRSA